ncbi:MAG: polysaccharide pyruvyl transferase family protein [Pseudomonadota bacterium]|nr:polysaccharide pyruvyl transferase family protein [Pseudomonadota bacterium]
MSSILKTFQKKRRKILKIVNRVVPSIEGTLKGNKITAYWYTGTVNFGDLLTPIILKHYGFTPVCYPLRKAQVLSTGSILQSVPESYSGNIIGSGLIKNTSLQLKTAKIWALRGKLTQERIYAPRDTVLGDPGLLALNLLQQRQKRSYVLGIVPHYVDQEDPRIAMLKKRYGTDLLVIDVKRDPMLVFADIDRCDCILSSSLHGVIVADSLNIPNAWIYLSDKVRGKGFKFHDYYSGIGMNCDPLYLDGGESLSQLVKYAHKPPEVIAEVIERLDHKFRSFGDYFIGL